jgi:phosphoribosylformimino-5-aminoimidazole carboxamide ribotide isomerase
MKIIPAIDIMDGKCVRLTQGAYSTRKIYSEDPLEMARAFEDKGIQYLHLVDLDGAKANRIVNHAVLERIASQTRLRIDFGGGLKSDEDLQIAFDCGAEKITGGSIAVKDRTRFLGWLARYGAERILLGADCRDRMISSNGWLEASELDVVDFIKSYEACGIKEVVSTDIAKDGMLRGPSFDLYREILENTKVELIASGGISSMEDLRALHKMGCAGAIVGKALYEGKITLNALSELC